MEQLRNLGDARQTDFCVYCGGVTETRDHVPSKVFLDKPYPTNIPVVPACQSCNRNISRDEEYVACLIECSLTGSAKADGVHGDNCLQQRLWRSFEDLNEGQGKLKRGWK